MKYVAGARPVKEDSSATSETSAYDVQDLLDKCGEILRREVTNLLMESSRGKLGEKSARDLAAYIKLLSDLKEEETAKLTELTDEQLQSIIKK